MTGKTKKRHEDADVTWREVMRFAWHYWRRSARTGVFSMTLLLGAVALDAVVPLATGRMVDAMTKGAGDAHMAWLAFGAFVALSVTQRALRVASALAWNRFAVRNLHAIVNDGMRKVQRFSSDWHANTFAGATVRKITRGMWSFDMFEDTLRGLSTAFVVMVCMTVMLAMALPLVGLAAAGAILLFCGGSVWMSVRLLAPRFRASAAEDTRVGATLADIITTNPTVKSFGTELREEALFRAVTDSWRAKAIRAWQTAAWADGARGALRVLMLVSMMATTIALWSSGRATPGDITLVLTVFFIIGSYLHDIGQQIANLQRAVGDMEDIILFWLREDRVADASGALPLRIAPEGEKRGEIVFDNVRFKYAAADRWIYDNLSVTVAAGEKVALVGASGSGKSTFVKLIQRLYDVDGGTIRIDGQDISRVTMESLRQSIALVPQDPALFHRALSDNIAYGKPGAAQEDIIAAARQAFAHEFIGHLPHGYDTLVGERGVKLSGGERQRVAIARAILADTPILILDEATSSLDSISEHTIQKALEKLMEGRTTITIAHRLSTVQKADRILVFDDGKIIEQGSHAALMGRDSRYRQLYEMQAFDMRGEDAA